MCTKRIFRSSIPTTLLVMTERYFRIAEDHRQKMEDFEVRRASEHAEIRQRYETKSQEIRAEAERDRALMEKNRQEQIRLHSV